MFAAEESASCEKGDYDYGDFIRTLCLSPLLITHFEECLIKSKTIHTIEDLMTRRIVDNECKVVFQLVRRMISIQCENGYYLIRMILLYRTISFNK